MQKKVKYFLFKFENQCMQVGSINFFRSGSEFSFDGSGKKSLQRRTVPPLKDGYMVTNPDEYIYVFAVELMLVAQCF